MTAIKTPKHPFNDAQEMARQHPNTFQSPTADALAAVGIGSFVKVCAGRERFWVKIEAVGGQPGHWVGVVDNDLVCHAEHGLAYEDRVAFENRHIYQADLPPQASRPRMH